MSLEESGKTDMGAYGARTEIYHHPEYPNREFVPLSKEPGQAGDFQIAQSSFEPLDENIGEYFEQAVADWVDSECTDKYDLDEVVEDSFDVDLREFNEFFAEFGICGAADGKNLGKPFVRVYGARPRQ